jgi:hypothetical protein
MRFQGFNVSKFLAPVSLLLLLNASSCAQKSDFVQPLDDGRIVQKSSVLAPHYRFYFKHKPEDGLQYLGVGRTETFKTVNPHSIPPDQRHRFLRVDFMDRGDGVLHSEFVSNQFYGQSDNSNYLLYHYVYDFFVDLSETAILPKIDKIRVSDLNQQQVRVISVNPEKEYIPEAVRADGWNGNLRTLRLMGSAPTERAFDIVVLGDGFTEDEMQTHSDEALRTSFFGTKVSEYMEHLLTTAPYNELKEKINVWIVATPSIDSGTNIPSEGLSKRTTFSATFDAYCTRRALIVQKQGRVLEKASLVPFDQILVLVNSEEYGGQGSDVATFSLNRQSPGVLVHEMGHSIGMLADEYSYFSDSEAQKNCPDRRIRDYAVHGDRNWGRNRMHSDNNALAPNLNLHPSEGAVKWQKYLGPQSPVVYFDYPLRSPVIDRATQTLSASFRLQSDREHAYLLFAAAPRMSSLFAKAVQSVSVDFEGREVELPFTLVHRGNEHMMLSFIALDQANLKSSSASELTVKLRIQADEIVMHGISSQRTNRNMLVFVSEVFEPLEMGLFQGATPSLSEVFRPNFCSYMFTHECPITEYQIKTTTAILEQYMN